MIIIDMNQISVASLMMQLAMDKTKIVEEDKVRHMILNSIRMYRSQFHEEYGEVVLAYDSKHGVEISFLIINRIEKSQETKIIMIGNLYLIV